MLQQLKDANVELSPVKVNPSKLQTVTPALQALVSKSTELKDLAQRALVSQPSSDYLLLKYLLGPLVLVSYSAVSLDQS